MELFIECECGKTLNIIRTETTSSYVGFTVEPCSDCETENYKAGEADAKQ